MKYNVKDFFSVMNLPNIIVVAITYIFYFIAFFLTFRYNRLNPTLYFVVFGLIFVIILLFGVVSFEGIIEKSKKLKIVGISVLSVLSLFLFISIYYVSRINNSIGNVIVNPTHDTEVKTAFVVFDTDAYANVSDLNGVKLGILSNSENNDRNSFVKSEVEAHALNITFIEFLSYNDMLLGLFNKEIDVAALPADFYHQFSDYEGYAYFLDKTTIVHEYTTNVTKTINQVDIDVTKEPFSMLIMGNDGGRTDSLILATYNPLNLAVTMTSISRDSFVPIACYPNQQSDKIGHAFFVSRECAIQTVSDLFDIEINYYVEINFKGVVEIVDALDKVWLNSPVEFVGQNSDDERGHYTVWVPKGGFWATGEMALTLARERYNMPGGDYQRQENQQQVIRSILERTLELNDIDRALNVLDAAGNNVKTNMSLDQMISIFNVLMNAISTTGLDPEFILDIRGSRVMGYPSFTYNESLQLPLWIFKPFEGSIRDLRALMLSNLEPHPIPTQIRTQFDARLVFYEEDFFAKVYTEREIHEQLPDFMPRMANRWKIEDAKSWAAARGILLTVEEIRKGHVAYTENVVHNLIIGQSVRYGIKTSSFKNLTIQVIKHELNCNLVENKEYDECKYKLPDFQDYGGNMTTISYVIAWFRELQLSPRFIYTLIPETDPRYDVNKIGYVIKQEPVVWPDVRTLTELELTVMDPNYSITIPDTSKWTESLARDWVKNNLEFETNIDVRYEATTDATLVGTVKSVSPSTGNSIKFQEVLKIVVYGESYTLTNYIDQTRQEVQNNFCNLNIASCVFVNVETSDKLLVGRIASQDPVTNMTRLRSEWLNTRITFGVFVENMPVTTP